MNLGLERKVALVTAASRGLGRAVATELARESAQVVVFSRDEGTLRTTATEIAKETSTEVTYFPGDLSLEEDIGALVSYAGERFGRVDVLINNTGGPPVGGFDDFGDRAWRGVRADLIERCSHGARSSTPHAKSRRRRTHS